MNRDICLQVEGALLERLIQRALDEGASFASLKRTGKRSLLACTDAGSAAILISLCKRYGLNCRQLRRGGRAALLDLVRARWTLIPAMALCALICALALSRIWMVDVRFTGPNAHLGDEAALRACLQESGVKAGMAAGDADTDLLQARLFSSAGNYSYVGVRRQGMRLLVEAAPESPAPPVHDLSQGRDLVAARDGVVESIRVYSGQACVQAGDTVKRGQLLIRGAEKRGVDSETGEDITASVNARGEIIARCWYEGRAEGEIYTIEQRRSGESRIESRLKILNFSLPLNACESYPFEETQREILPVVGLFLPLEIERITHWETRSFTRRADYDALCAHLTALARSDVLSALFRDGIEYETASVWTDAQQDGNTLRIRAVHELYTDIAVTRDALIEEVY